MKILHAMGLLVFLTPLEIHNVNFKSQISNLKLTKSLPAVRQGFTLVEIVVVFAIISVISIIAAVSFVNYNKTQNLQVAVSDLTSILTLARSRALSQAKPPECSNQDKILNGYRVDLFLQTNSYELNAVCSDISPVKIQSSNLPKDIIFDSRTTSASFYFPVIVNGVIGAGSIYITGYGQEKIIIVDPSGGVR